jgi:hypothetical protein
MCEFVPHGGREASALAKLRFKKKTGVESCILVHLKCVLSVLYLTLARSQVEIQICCDYRSLQTARIYLRFIWLNIYHVECNLEFSNLKLKIELVGVTICQLSTG